MLIRAGGDYTLAAKDPHVMEAFPDVNSLFNKGLEFWRPRDHTLYRRALCRTMHLLVLLQKRSDNLRSQGALPHMPIELYLLIGTYFTSIDFRFDFDS